MERRLINGLLLMGIAILAEVLSGALGLITFIFDGSLGDYTALSCFIGIIGAASYVLIIIGLIMIFTRRKTLGKGARFISFSLIALIVMVIGFLAISIVGIFTIFNMNPRYYTISIIGNQMISAILGTLMIFLLVYPLVNKNLKIKIKYSFFVIVMLAAVAQPFAFTELREIEDDFHREFAGRSFNGTKEMDDELYDDLIGWYMNTSGSESVNNLAVYNSLQLIPYTYIGVLIFLYARKIKKSGVQTRDFRHPDIGYPPGIHERVGRNILKKEEKCRYCGAELQAGLDFCPSCGAYLKE